MSLTIFNKEYDGESLYDLPEDVGDSVNEDYNRAMSKVPKDPYGFPIGKFTVSIVWSEE